MSDKFTDQTLDVKYVIELESKLHSNHCTKNNKEALKNNELAKALVDQYKIYYNSKPLYEAFYNQIGICQSYVTFKAKKMYVAKSKMALVQSITCF